MRKMRIVITIKQNNTKNKLQTFYFFKYGTTWYLNCKKLEYLRYWCCVMPTFYKVQFYILHILQHYIVSADIKFLWDINIQYDHDTQARRSEIIFVNKVEKRCSRIDIGIPGDEKLMRSKRMEKYLELKREIKKLLGFMECASGTS